jgi:hypothetical protein
MRPLIVVASCLTLASLNRAHRRPAHSVAGLPARGPRDLLRAGGDQEEFPGAVKNGLACPGIGIGVQSPKPPSALGTSLGRQTG